jgi:hypothetical protein
LKKELSSIICFTVVSLLSITGCSTHDGPAVWKETVIPLYLNREANSKSEECLVECIDEWNRVLDGRISFSYAGRNRAGLRRDSKNTVSFLVTWPRRVKDSYIGYAYNWKRSGVIRESDIILNQYLYKFTVQPEKVDNGYFYLKAILLHEMGHVLGLDHTDDPASIMQPIFSKEQTLSLDSVDYGTVVTVLHLYK